MPSKGKQSPLSALIGIPGAHEPSSRKGIAYRIFHNTVVTQFVAALAFPLYSQLIQHVLRQNGIRRTRCPPKPLYRRTFFLPGPTWMETVKVPKAEFSLLNRLLG